ncbi:MAG: prepilin-type N-terminal cleavage/methylation domain-containing protein [Coriobacteriia bacterium]|nr:prepilin-type N-terminal cleavage/methylation domain-containing protein [Coriobacteriia bacterium]
MKNRVMREDDGFTLIEVVTVVAIMAILVLVAVASFVVSVDASRRMTCLQNQRTMRSAILSWEVEHQGDFPPDLETIHDRVKWGSGYATCVSTAADFTYDPATGSLACPNPNHQTP